MFKYTTLLWVLVVSFYCSQASSIVGVDGSEVGSLQVTLLSADSAMLLTVEMCGLTPGWHGMHIHQNPDCSDAAEGFKRSGGHVNFLSKEHGYKHKKGYHMGDLANIYAGDDGCARVQQWVSSAFDAAYVRLQKPKRAALIVHEAPDDYHTQPIGGAGARVGCAVLAWGE